jgi:hypothetical protein
LIYSSPAIGPDGSIYFGANDNYKVFALDTHGSKKWEFLTGWHIESSAAVGHDGTVYIGSGDNNLYAFSPDGVLKWTTPLAAYVSSSPAVAADGTVYCASLRSVSAFDSSGSNLWTVLTNMGPFFYSSPVIGPDGTVYISGGYSTSCLYALYGTAPPQESAWPMFRRDLRHNARSIQRGITGPKLLPDGRAAMTLTVETGRTYCVEASADFAAWTNLATFTNSAPTSVLIDRDATNSALRFYRLLAP